jgi:anti-anti-sigma factor
MKEAAMLDTYLRIEDRKAIIYCEGRLVRGGENALLGAVALTRVWKHLTLDLGGVRAIDAGGLGVLATIARWAQQQDVEFAISNPTRWVHYLIHLVQLDIVIPVVQTQVATLPGVESQVAAFATDRPQGCERSLDTSWAD